MRNLTAAIFFVLIPFFAASAMARENLNEDFLTNHYHISTGNEDWGTIYLLEDHTYSWMPYYRDSGRRHICTGNWRFSKRDQTLKLGRAPGCLILEGTFQVNREGPHLRLSNADKTLIFRSYE